MKGRWTWSWRFEPIRNDKEREEETCTTEKYSWIPNKRNPNFTYYSTNHENHQPEWHTSIPQSNRFQWHFHSYLCPSNWHGNFTKELILHPSYSRDIVQNYLEYNTLLINPTEIKNGVDFCQGGKNQWRYDNRMITEISSMKKETVRLLLAPTG